MDDETEELEAEWRTIDFRPAPAGWRAIFIDGDGKAWGGPVAGWVIQELAPDGRRDEWLPPADRDRRILPTVVTPDSGPEPWVIDLADERFFRLLGPGEPPVPTSDIEAEHRRRARTETRWNSFEQTLRDGQQDH